jgi:hypothetical protein
VLASDFPLLLIFMFHQAFGYENLRVRPRVPIISLFNLTAE